MTFQDIIEYLKEHYTNESDIANTIFELIEDLKEIDYINNIVDIPDIIFSGIIEYCDGNFIETKETMNCLKEEFNENPQKYVDNFEIQLDEFCDCNNLCRNCFRELEVYKHSEIRGEYMGTDCYEEVYDTYCICGYRI